MPMEIHGCAWVCVRCDGIPLLENKNINHFVVVRVFHLSVVYSPFSFSVRLLFSKLLVHAFSKNVKASEHRFAKVIFS